MFTQYKESLRFPQLEAYIDAAAYFSVRDIPPKFEVVKTRVNWTTTKLGQAGVLGAMVVIWGYLSRRQEHPGEFPWGLLFIGLAMLAIGVGEDALQRSSFKAQWTSYQKRWGDRNECLKLSHKLLRRYLEGSLENEKWYEATPTTRFAFALSPSEDPPAVEQLQDGAWVAMEHLPGGHWSEVLHCLQARKEANDRASAHDRQNRVRRAANSSI